MYSSRRKREPRNVMLEPSLIFKETRNIMKSRKFSGIKGTFRARLYSVKHPHCKSKMPKESSPQARASLFNKNYINKSKLMQM